MQHIAVLCIWHVCMCVCVCVVCLHAYIHVRAHAECISWEGLCVAEKKSGAALDRVARHIEPSSSFGASVSGMLCLVDVDVKVFLGIDYSFDPATLSPLFSRRQEGLRRAYNHGHYLLSRPSRKINTLGRPETRDRSL